jgi:hypothetical protein
MNMRRTLPFAAAALTSLGGCGSGNEAAPVVAADTVATSPLPQAVTSLAGPCELISPTEIAKRVGPLDGAPVREGNGCWYYVATDTTTAEWRQAQAGAERARAGGMDTRAIAMYHPTRAGVYAEVDTRGDGQATTEKPTNLDAGWDEVRISPTGTLFNGRAGFVRVSVKSQLLALPVDTMIAIAAALRDGIPQGPIPHPAADRSGRTPPARDPCSVLTRDEAQAVLGELVAAPFRARERTPLADPTGKSCAFLTAGHRVLVLTPVWDYAGLELNAARMIGSAVRQVADLPGIEGDTLEGKFDEAVVDLAGELLFRKGGRGVGVRYQMSSTNAAGAIRLAEAALARLATLPDSQD